MDLAISLSIPAQVDRPVSVCVPAKQLADLVTLMKGSVNFTVRDKQAYAETETAKYRLPMLPASDFREIAAADDEKLSIDGKLLAGMLSAASIAMETNPNREDRWKSLEIAAIDGKLSITGMS